MEEISRNTSVEDVIKGYPTLTKVFIDFGLPCLVCGEPFWGTIEELARQNDVDINVLLNKLNQQKRKFDEKS